MSTLLRGALFRAPHLHAEALLLEELRLLGAAGARSEVITAIRCRAARF